MADEHKDHHGEGDHGGGSHGGGGHGGGHGGHGGGGHAEGEHEGAPEWLISFADMVMLIMAFFVIMLAMNMGPKGGGESDAAGAPSSAEERMMDLAIAIREGFNNPIDPFGSDPAEAPLRRRMIERKGGPTNESGVEGNAPEQQAIRPSDYKNVAAVVSFDERSSLLGMPQRETLSEVAGKLRGQRWIIEVRGHVSPFEHARNRQATMDLAYERAMATASALVEFGLTWDVISVVSRGDSDRVVARPLDAEQSKSNQRVEIVVTNEVAPPDPYTARGASAGAGTAGSSDE